MAEMNNDLAAQTVATGLEATAEKTQEMVTEVVKKGFDMKSGVIGGVVGATLVAGGTVIGKRIKNKPHEITEEIKKDPRVRAATEKKIIKELEKAQATVEKCQAQLDELHKDDVEDDFFEVEE